MFKKCLLFLFFFLALPAFSGQVEDALSKGHNVFLYLYSPKCKYCTMFAPTYNKLTKKHDGEFVFIKTDSTTSYGNDLMYKFRAGYVPYVILLNANKKTAVQITPACLLDMVCTENSMKEFRAFQ